MVKNLSSQRTVRVGLKLRCQTPRSGNMGDQLRTKQGRRTEFVGTIAGKGRNLHQESCRFRLAEVFADHNQASSVSGFATAANSSKAFRPSRWAISASVAFSASDNNNRPLIWALRIRFSAARYSFLSRSSWSTVPVMKPACEPKSFQSLPKVDRRTRIVHALEVSESSCVRKL